MHHTQVNTDNREHLSSSLSSSEMIELAEDLLSLLREAATPLRLDFLDAPLTEEDYLAWTGWIKDQFDDMVSLISPYLRSSSNRHIRNSVGMFWIKLKTSLSFRQIGSLLNVLGDSENRRKRAADAFDSIRLWVVEHFVPRHLGVRHLSRDEATKQNTSFSTEFFGRNVTIIWDGTYIYVGKSSSHSINRNTYSGHK